MPMVGRNLKEPGPAPDPFGFSRKQRSQEHAFQGAKKAKSSFKGPVEAVGRALGKVGFPDDHYRNQLQKAQAGLLKQIDTKGLSPRQISVLKGLMSGKERSY